MASRMEKYYKTFESTNKRSQKNQDLYNEIYEAPSYSNIEAVATLEHTNEIDITKIKNMLKNREDYKRQKEYREIVNPLKEKEEIKIDHQIEEIKPYDIKEELEKIKAEETEDDKYRSLGNTNYNILKELKIKNNVKDEEEDLKELINTITSTSLLNKLDNEELSLNMFDDLASSGNTIVSENNTVEALLEEAKALEKRKEETDTSTLDNSFFTSSLAFDKSDFEDSIDTSKKNKVSLKIKITVAAIFFIISAIVIFLIYKVIG